MNFSQMISFYKDNPVMLLFVITNLLANTLCAWITTSPDTAIGVFGRAVAVSFALGLGLGLPIIGWATAEAFGLKRRGAAAVLIAVMIPFTVIDLALSYAATVGRFEYAHLNAAKQQTLNQTYTDIAKTSSATLNDCVRWKNCDSQERMDTANRAAEKLESTAIAISPQETLGETFVKWLIIGIAVGSSLGGTIMGFIAGMGVEYREKKPAKLGIAA